MTIIENVFKIDSYGNGNRCGDGDGNEGYYNGDGGGSGRGDASHCGNSQHRYSGYGCYGDGNSNCKDEAQIYGWGIPSEA